MSKARHTRISSRKAIVLRWLDIVCLALAATGVSIVISPSLQSLRSKVYGTFDGFATEAILVVVVVVSSFLWLIVIRLGGFRLTHLRPDIFFRYPPSWLAGPIAIGTLICLPEAYVGSTFKSSHLAESHSLPLALLAVFAGLAMVLVFETIAKGYKESERRVSNVENQSHTDILDDPDALRRWIRSEKPIQRPDEDIFDLAPIAERISSVLAGGDEHTVGLVGPYGSGKSSLLNMVEYYLTVGAHDGPNRPKWLICRVGAWGRNPTRIVEQIIRHAVDTLSRHADALALSSLPARYKAIMSGRGHIWGEVLATILSETGDPLDSLRRLDTVLAATSARMTIIIEDVDRNTSRRMLCDELPAFLDHIGGLGCVTFILAIGAERPEAQLLMRICDRLESIA